MVHVPQIIKSKYQKDQKRNQQKQIGIPDLDVYKRQDLPHAEVQQIPQHLLMQPLLTQQKQQKQQRWQIHLQQVS